MRKVQCSVEDIAKGYELWKMEGRAPIRERGDEKSFEVLGDMGHAASRSEVFDGLDGSGWFRGAAWCSLLVLVGGRTTRQLAQKAIWGVGDSVIR